MYHIIVNGINFDKKREEKIDKIRQVFEKAGKHVEFHVTDHAGHAKEIAAALTLNGAYADLVAMGGDGTLHEVLNGIEDIANCTLGLIPEGTGNDFAQAVQIPSDPVAAAENIIFRAPSPIDFIELESGLRSINAVGTGIDVEVLKRVYAKPGKKRIRYFANFLKALHRYKYTSFGVSWDGGEQINLKGMLACLGNGTQFGGGIKMFPEAKPDDGYIDLVAVDYVSPLRTLTAFLKLMAGKAHKIKEVTYVKCKSVKFVPEDGVSPTVQAEGELYENMPLDAHIVAGQLKFYLPKGDRKF